MTVEIELPRRVQDILRAIDFGRVDVPLGIKRKRRGAMDHDIATLGDLLHRRDIADITLRELEPRLGLLGIVEVGNVKNSNLIHLLRAKETDEIYALSQRQRVTEDNDLADETSYSPRENVIPVKSQEYEHSFAKLEKK